MLPSSGWLREAMHRNVPPLVVPLPATVAGQYLDYADGPVVTAGAASLVSRMVGTHAASIVGGTNADGDVAIVVELRQRELFGVVLVDRITAPVLIVACGDGPPASAFAACGVPPASVWAPDGAAPASVWSEG